MGAVRHCRGHRHAANAPSARRRFLHIEPRYQVVLACFLATLTAYVERVGFSIAWTAMCSKVGGRAG